MQFRRSRNAGVSYSFGNCMLSCQRTDTDIAKSRQNTRGLKGAYPIAGAGVVLLSRLFCVVGDSDPKDMRASQQKRQRPRKRLDGPFIEIHSD